MSENIDNERGKTFTAQKPMTDPTADAAKLPTCPFPWRGDEGTIRQCVERGHCGCGENTRPQPAPPDGEPNFGSAKWRSQLAQRLAEEVWEIFANGGFPAGQFTEAVYRHLLPILDDRLGLAARPKVEDDPAMVELEVATAIQTLLDGSMKPIAALLERLAGDLQNWWSAAIVAMKAQEAAEAKLAEREAELAKADAVIWLLANESISSGSDEKDWHEQSCNRHAARQQQKS